MIIHHLAFLITITFYIRSFNPNVANNQISMLIFWVHRHMEHAKIGLYYSMKGRAPDDNKSSKNRPLLPNAP